MTPRLYTVPYDSGHKGLRMGAGPLRLRGEFALPAEEIEPDGEWRAEIGTTFQLYRNLAKRIASNGKHFPLVLSGNCGAAIGTAAGIGMDDLAVLWFDAHGDFNTPETSRSGYLDGMALSILNGRCFTPMTAAIPGFVALPFERTAHAGGHDLDPSEVEDFKRYEVGVIRAGQDPLPVLDRLAKNASRLLIHIDLDVLDTSHGRANHYAAAGGMSPADVTRIIESCGSRFQLAGLVMASFDPAYDADGRIAAAAVGFAKSAMSFC